MFSFSAPQVFVGFEIYGFTLDCEDPLIIFESVCNRNQIEQNPEDEAAIPTEKKIESSIVVALQDP
jgi:hypothetical protein